MEDASGGAATERAFHFVQRMAPLGSVPPYAFPPIQFLHTTIGISSWRQSRQSRVKCLQVQFANYCIPRACSNIAEWKQW